MEVDANYEVSYFRLRTLENGEWKLVPKNVLFLGQQGHGKTMAMETMLDVMYDEGFNIFIPTDIKDNYEMAWVGLEPNNEWHLKLLRQIRRKPRKLPITIIHPFTFNIKKNTELHEDTELISFSIKDLNEDDLSILLETFAKSDLIKAVLYTIDKLKDNEGINELLLKLKDYSGMNESYHKGHKIKKLVQPLFIEEGFNIDVKDIRKISSLFMSFLEDECFIMPKDFKHNIDYSKYIKDSSRIKFFSVEKLKSEKMKYFARFKFYNDLDRRKKEFTMPVAYFLGELRYYTPNKTKIPFKEFTAINLGGKLILARSSYKEGCWIIGDAQVYDHVDPRVIESFNFKFAGKLSGIKDLGSIAKNLRFDTDLVEKNRALKTGHFISLEEDTYPIVKFFPSRMGHQHIGYDFMDTCRNLNLLKKFPEIIEDFRQFRINKIKEMQEFADKFEAQQIKKIEDKIKAELENSKAKQEVKELKSQIKSQQKEKLSKRDELIMDYYDCVIDGVAKGKFNSETGKRYSLRDVQAELIKLGYSVSQTTVSDIWKKNKDQVPIKKEEQNSELQEIEKLRGEDYIPKINTKDESILEGKEIEDDIEFEETHDLDG